MNRTIAVICASPPGINPGMESVDLALLSLSEKYGFRDQIQFFRLYPVMGGSVNEGKGKLSYSIIPPGDDFFQTKKVVIYWGDFLHMRQYHETVARKLVTLGQYTNLDEAQERVRQVFLQSGQNVEVREKTITFGSTLLFNTIQDEMYAPYQAALEQFLKMSKGIWFRDVYSALKACHIRGTFQPGCLGVDCACLVDPQRTLQFDSQPAVRDHAGVFLGRTTGKIKVMIDFSRDLTKALGLKLSWLAWGDENAFPALPSIFKLEAIRSLDSYTEAPASPVELALAELFKYRIIITDTYHLCVNAWNQGIPAICFTDDEFSYTRNVNFGDYHARRDKRAVFMSMYDALDFVVPTSELANRAQRAARIKHLSEILQSVKVIEAIQERIRLHAQSAEAELVHGLSGLL